MIVKNLRQSREILDIKQKEVAEKLNVHFSTVSGWETGKDTIPLERLIQYANIYKFSLDYLFGITKNNNYKPLKINVNEVAKNLRLLRKQNNLTQLEVAQKLNTTQPSYSHYENATYLITTTFLYNLTKIYKSFSIDSLFIKK